MIIFMLKYTIINMNCQHYTYLESMKNAENWGNAKKHNEQILEHNRLNLNEALSLTVEAPLVKVALITSHNVPV